MNPAACSTPGADADLVVIIDATHGGGEPGTIQVLSPTPAERARSNARLGTHALGVDHALALGRAVGRMPRSLVIVGIEGHDHALGETLSAPVAAAVEPAVDLLASIVRGPQQRDTAGAASGPLGLA